VVFPACEYSLEQLSRCKKDQLQCFVHARASKSALGLTSAVKKGMVTAAARGEDCPLRRAFCAQNRPVILEESVAKVLARRIAGILAAGDGADIECRTARYHPICWPAGKTNRTWRASHRAQRGRPPPVV